MVHAQHQKLTKVSSEKSPAAALAAPSVLLPHDIIKHRLLSEWQQ